MTLTTPILPTATDQPGPSRHGTARVVAVLVSHDGARWLPRALHALTEQTRPPDVVVAVDTGSTDSSPALLRTALGEDRVHSAPRSTGFGAAVALGLAQVDPPVRTPTPTRHRRTPEREQPPRSAGADGPDDCGDDWIWLLHDDCAPQPRALELLLEAATGSAQVGVVGPKLVAWDDATRLLEVGHTVSRGGRRTDGLDGAVRDQGQHDHRRDVLAVGSAGLLVRRDLWDRLGGLDPALPLLRDDLDLCWRAHLAGRRVVVAPDAVVADAQASTRGLRRADAVRGPVRRAERRHGLHVALARCSPWTLPLLCVQVLLHSLGWALLLLAAKAPGAALDEVLAAGAVLFAPWRWLGSRWRSRGTRTVRRSGLSALLTPRTAVLRRAVDEVAAWRGTQHTGPGPGVGARMDAPAPETGPAADEVQPISLAPPGWWRRLATAPLTWVLLGTAAATGLAARNLVGTGALTGGALGRVGGDRSQLWRDSLGSLHGAGLGSAGPASPADVVRAALVRALDPLAGGRAAVRAVDLLVLGAPLLSAVSAYLAARTATRSRAARAWAAAVWGVSPLLTTWMSQGRLGPVAVHALLPLVAAAVARALAPAPGGSWTAVFAAALGLAVVGAVLRSLLVLGLLVVLGGLVLGHGGTRLRALALLVLAPALLGPWLLELVRRPALLLAGPGAVDVGAPVDGSSGAPLALLAASVHRPAGWPVWTLAVALAPVLLVGLLGVLREGTRGRSAIAACAVSLVGAAAALVLPHVVLAGPSADGAVPGLRGWGGGPLAVVLLGALAAALAGVDGLRSRLRPSRFGWRLVVVAPVLLACLLAPVAAAAGWAWRGADRPLHRGTVPALPAVAADAASGPDAVRTLVLQVKPGAATYRLQGAEPEDWTRNVPGRDAGDRAAADVVPAAVAGLLAEGVSPPSGRDDVAAPSGAKGQQDEDPVAALRRLAVGFVLVGEPVPTDTAARLDSLGGLTRIGAPRGARLWRVGTASATALDPAAARVQLLDAKGATVAAVPVAGPHAAVDTTVAAGPAGRRLVLSEAAAPQWRASLDGRRLAAVRMNGDGAWRQAFALPPTGGHLVVEHVDALSRGWQQGQLVLVALVALLALPVRRPGVPR